jgi:hypothetical protein
MKCLKNCGECKIPSEAFHVLFNPKTRTLAIGFLTHLYGPQGGCRWELEKPSDPGEVTGKIIQKYRPKRVVLNILSENQAVALFSVILAAWREMREREELSIILPENFDRDNFFATGRSGIGGLGLPAEFFSHIVQ